MIGLHHIMLIYLVGIVGLTSSIDCQISASYGVLRTPIDCKFAWHLAREHFNGFVATTNGRWTMSQAPNQGLEIDFKYGVSTSKTRFLTKSAKSTLYGVVTL